MSLISVSFIRVTYTICCFSILATESRQTDTEYLLRYCAAALLQLDVVVRRNPNVVILSGTNTSWLIITWTMRILPVNVAGHLTSGFFSQEALSFVVCHLSSIANLQYTLGTT